LGGYSTIQNNWHFTFKELKIWITKWINYWQAWTQQFIVRIYIPLLWQIHVYTRWLYYVSTTMYMISATVILIDNTEEDEEDDKKEKKK
jgi:hypothetical protein